MAWCGRAEGVTTAATMVLTVATAEFLWPECKSHHAPVVSARVKCTKKWIVNEFSKYVSFLEQTLSKMTSIY